MRIVSEVPAGSGRAVGCGDAVAEAMHKRITEKRKRGAPANALRRLCDPALDAQSNVSEEVPRGAEVQGTLQGGPALNENVTLRV